MLTPKKVVPTGQVWAGNPAKFLRELDEDEASFILQSANNYAALAAVHSAENSKSFEEIQVRSFRLRTGCRYTRRILFAAAVLVNSQEWPYDQMSSEPEVLCQIDKDRRRDARERDPDYDSHLGLERDPITREITNSSGTT